MRTLAHISDLHFGAEESEVAAGLCRDLHAVSPALVIVSGDLTQRARRRQFLAARKFLNQLPTPWLVVPGNHDVPLFDWVRRFLSPLHYYCRYVSAELNPLYQDAELVVLGLNTARSLTWKNGRISFAQMLLMQRAFGSLSPPRFKILVTHHPFVPPPGETQGTVQLVGRAQHALQVLDACEVDLLLAGHLHHGYTADVRVCYPATKRSMIVAQAGTAISRRVRHQSNAYNLLTFDRDRIEIAVRVWQRGKFSTSNKVTYYREPGGWKASNSSKAD